MKKLSLIALACLMVLGLAQCKKNEPTNNNTADNGNRVNITLKLDNGGQKVHPEEENGLANIVYDNGDVVYVGSNGKYMGCLTYNGTLFAGSINAAATEGQPLQFIFMGGQDFHESLTENSTEEYTFNIGDQSNGLAVISGAASNEDFSLTNLSYTAYLRNKCALVKFNLGDVSTDAAITLTGLKNTATIGFDGTVTNGTTTGGIVTYGTGSTRYAVVLSDQEAVTEGTVSAEGYEGTFSIPTAAYTNAFLTDATMTLTGSVGPTPVDLTTPLTLEALEDGNIVVNIMNVGGKGGGVYPGSSKGGPGGGRSSNIRVKYSVNGGETTTIYETTTETTTIPVNAGDKVQFYGDDTSTQFCGDEPKVVLQGTAETKVYGNIMSLLDEDNYATLTTLPNGSIANFAGLFSGNENLTDASGLLLPATTLAGCYYAMFAGCTSLTTAPALPAETLAGSCYTGMFYGCTNLTTAPELPATTLAESCYNSMFYGCTSLTTAPALPAETLASDCYRSMFKGCTSLTTAPALPAETLANYCYRSMFSGCTSLTTAPVLPATTLANSCYNFMFNGCTSLNSVTCMATNISASNCTSNWLQNVAATGTFTKASGATWPEGVNGIPSGWTVNEQ